jgi:TPR repeat protein
MVLALGMDLGLAGDAVARAGAAAGLEGQMLAEQKQFLECMVYVYNPGLWISYDNWLYFRPRNDSQRKQIEAMKAARERFVAFTNRETRHQFVAKVLAESGLDADWQKKLLLPYSAANPSLTPVLGRPVQIVERYSILKALPTGDVLIQAGDSIFSVMGFGRGANDAYLTNAVLVEEGRMTYRTERKGLEWVEAFTDAALTAAETAALDQAVAAFQRKAAELGQAMAAAQKKADAINQALAESRRKAPALTGETKARQDFADLQARAKETSPFMEYLLAKAYLEGKGTAKDEKLGLLWMNKAARDGSGDADSYLEGLKGK